MKYCEKCGKEILDEAKFCGECGTQCGEQVVTDDGMLYNTEKNAETEAEISTAFNGTQTANENVPKKKSKKGLIILAVVVILAIITAVVSVYVYSMYTYNKTLENVYEEMCDGAKYAEEYCSLQSKVWRNCIYEDDSYETDKYTKDANGKFYDDFNDAILSFYEGEKNKYNLVKYSIDDVEEGMAELKDCPSKYEDEYKALKEMYVAYSDLTDLVVGDSSYSCNTFGEALESAKSEFKSAKSSAKLLIE